MPALDTSPPTVADKPRLLVLASTYPRWAGDHEPAFVHALCVRLTESFEVHVICPSAPGSRAAERLEGIWIHRFRYAPRPLETLVQSGGILNNLKHHPWKLLLVPFFVGGLIIKTWRLNRRLQPNCIHAHWIIPQGLAAFALGVIQRCPTPFLLTSHGGDIFGLRGRMFEGVKRAVLGRASAITVVSQAMVSEAIRLGAPPERVHVIPMGVNFETLFTPGPTSERIPGEILFVGRLVEKKGLRYLIEALPAIIERIPEAHLKIAGLGPEEASLRALAALRGVAERVLFLGALPQSELPIVYRQASIFVSPFIVASNGDREGLGLVTIEAIACGCPVIVGDLPVINDIFSASEADMRVDPKNLPDLTERIVTTLADSEAAIARTLRLRDRLATQFGCDQIARQYAILLQDLDTSLLTGTKVRLTQKRIF